MLEVLKRAISIFDAMIIGAALFLFSRMDFENLNTSDEIYIAAFGIWLLMLCVRIFIIYKNSEGNDE